MAYDAQGNWVPDGTTPPPPGAPPAGGSYYTGDPNNPLTADPNAGFGVRSLPPGAVNGTTSFRVNPAAFGQGGIPGAAGPSPTPGMVAPNTGTAAGLGTSPLAGQFSNPNAYDPFGAGSPYDSQQLAHAYGQSQGWDPNSGSQSVLADRTNNLYLTYQLLNPQAAMNPTQYSYTDWANKYISQGAGQGLSTADFFNAAFTSDQLNPTWTMLHESVDPQTGRKVPLKPAEQVKAFYQLMDAALANTVPPPMLKAMESMYGQAGQEYIDAMNSGQYNGSFTDFLQQTGRGPQMLTGGQ